VKLALVLTLALAWAASCRPLPPPLPPPEAPGTCETAFETIRQLPDGCGMNLEHFVADCHDAEAAEAQDGVRLPVGCLTAAKTCEEAMACR
jgi:hypothetical protein